MPDVGFTMDRPPKVLGVDPYTGCVCQVTSHWMITAYTCYQLVEMLL